MTMTAPYQFDPTGTLLANRITGEQHIITAVSDRNYHFIVPTFAPFFTEGCTVSYRDVDNNVRYLVEGIDFLFCFQFIAASRSCAKPIYGGISFLNLQLAGVVTLVYQTVGGEWTLDPVQINQILSDMTRNPRFTSWEQVAQVPTLFPVVDHEWNLTDLVGMSEVVQSVDDIALAIANRPAATPVPDYGLIPTKDMLGLGNVQNFGVATDAEARAGTSITKYMTPRAVRLAIEFVINTIGDAAATLLELASKAGASMIGTATNQTLDQAVLRVKNITELRLLDIPSTDPEKVHTVLVLGIDTLGDSTSSTYYWSTSNNEVDNGYTVIRPISSNTIGRWIHEDKDAYAVYGFNSTANQTTYTLDRSPLPGTTVKVVINKFVELINTINFQINDKTITFLEALSADERIDIVIQTRPVKVNDPANRIYQKFIVANQNDVFLLTRRPVDSDGYCLRLNDGLVLFNGIDFTVTDNQISVIYPILAGDVLEFMSHFHPTGLPAFILRQSVGY
jgi:hypothetical protein